MPDTGAQLTHGGMLCIQNRDDSHLRPAESCYYAGTHISPYSAAVALCAEAVAQTTGHSVFLYVCDKTTTLGRAISVAKGPWRPPAAIRDSGRCER